MDNPRKKQQKAQGNDQQAQKPHALEWIISGFCALMVMAMIGYIFYQAISYGGTAEPDLEVRVEQVEKISGGFRIKFRAVNRGGETAGSVKVEGRLMSGQKAIETSEITLDYVPAHSHTSGGLLFNHDPGQYQVQLEAKSYRNL